MEKQIGFEFPKNIPHEPEEKSDKEQTLEKPVLEKVIFKKPKWEEEDKACPMCGNLFRSMGTCVACRKDDRKIAYFKELNQQGR